MQYSTSGGALVAFRGPTYKPTPPLSLPLIYRSADVAATIFFLVYSHPHLYPSIPQLIWRRENQTREEPAPRIQQTLCHHPHHHHHGIALACPSESHHDRQRCAPLPHHQHSFIQLFEIISWSWSDLPSLFFFILSRDFLCCCYYLIWWWWWSSSHFYFYFSCFGNLHNSSTIFSLIRLQDLVLVLSDIRIRPPIYVYSRW